ncbi:MAG: MarR family transcriptional regulator [Planctomycetaceae bacterium]|nr:MarR family transcriptional regulator [Planctomycetaceae bacterium]
MGREGRAREAALVDQLLELTARLQSKLSEPCEAQGVSSSRYAALRTIADVGDRGCSQKQLADQLGLSESNVCSLVERMRVNGLLFRFRSKTDRRRSVLMLTEEGRQLAEAITLTREAAAVNLLAGFGADQQAQLQRLVWRLSDHLDAIDRATSEHNGPTARDPLDHSDKQEMRRAS